MSQQTDAQLTTQAEVIRDETAVGGNTKTRVYSALKNIIDSKPNNDPSALTEKTTPVDADTSPINDSAASNALKKVTWANIKATLKTYFDTLYSTFSGSASDVTFTPSGGIAATDVQAAIEELDTEKATITYVDSKIDGLKWKDSVKVATTTAGTLATDFENGDTIDGIVLATSDRILIKDQATQSENGIYIVAATGAPTRSSDANTAAELEGATVPVQQGTSNENTSWTQTTDGITLGVSNIVWTALAASVADASETVKGKIEIATQAETDTGTDDVRAVTPLKVATRYAPLASPTLTGIPAAPTAALTVSTTQIATTAFVTGIMQFVTPEMYGAVGDGATDDSTAINNAIASGKAVYFGSKNYRIATTLTTTDDTRLFGDGVNSIISVATNIAVITIGGINGTIENLQILGSGSGAAQNGITAVGNAGFTLYRYNTRVYNVFFNDLGNAGMYTTYTIGADTGSEHQGTYYAVNCRATSCAVGYFMDTRGEYNTFSNCLADNCPIGVRFNGGNNSWTGGNIVDCTTGVYIGSGTNDGHGVITGAKINHTNITCSSTATGYAFVGCEIVACSITLTSCTDIRFYSCDIASSPITSTNAVGTVFHSNCFRTTPTITIAAGNNPTFVGNTFPAASTVHSLIVNTFQGGIQNTQQGPTSPNIFTSTWTTTASNQYTTLFTGTITPRATASDVTSGVVIDLDYTATANSQVYNQVSIVGTLATGGFSSTELNSLSVSGRTKLKDVATTGSTGVLELQDSAGATIAKWSADGIYRIGNAGSPAQLTTTSDGIVLSKSGNGLLFSMGAIGANFTATASGGGTANAHAIRAGGGSTISSAALPWTALLIDPTYNQTGTATGNVLGIDYNPTVTAVLGIHYGILVRPSCISGFAAGGTPADAYVVIGAGTTALAPFKLTSGTNLTTAVAGCMEYDGTNLFFTRTGTTRESVICSNAVNAVSPTAPDRTITVVIAGTTYYLHAKTTND